MGKLENYNLKLRIDPSVAPVAQRKRQIPFALHNKVNTLLKNEDVIEDITGEPTTWLNPLVIVP